MADGDKNRRTFAVYAVASQVSFIILMPLLFFVVGGAWVVDEFGLPQGLKVVFVLLGVFCMLGTLVSYLLKLAKLYGGGDEKKEADTKKYIKYKYDRRDYDFYDDNVKKKL